MTAALMWRMVRDRHSVFVIVNRYIVARIRIEKGDWEETMVVGHPSIERAQFAAVSTTEDLENRGYALESIHTILNPVDAHIPSQMLRLLSYYKAGDLGQLEVVSGQVTRTFYVNGEEVT